MDQQNNEVLNEQMSIAPEARTTKRRKKLLMFIGVGSVAIFIVAIFAFKSGQKAPATMFTVMNTESSVYKSDQMVRILISTVGTDRNTLCHSNLQVVVTGPKKFKTELSTANESITTSTTCDENGSKTNDPDYQASFVPQTEGTYKIELINPDNKEKVIKKIEVKNDSTFNFERGATTRINPSEGVRYHMVLRITSKNDFKGKVVELIPQNVTIAWLGEAKLDSEKITWEVNLKAGETKEIVYDYIMPQAEGNTRDFGPAAIYSGSRKVFEEKNSWQIVIGQKLEQISGNFPSLLQLFSPQYL